MKLSINWLKDYISLNKSVDEIADSLTMIGNEVEEIITTGDIPGVIVAEIKEIIPHPNADKLQLAKIYDGKNTLSVVCGAPNIKEGQKIFLATIGTNLPDPNNNSYFEIKKSKIRGELSEGMICSEKELGISDDHEGIMVLPNDYELGASISNYYSETILDIDVTPNRVDCLSVVGLARDLSAKFSQRLNFDYQVNYPIEEKTSIIAIEDKDICSRYTGIQIESVNIKESPDWLKKRLISIGERPINNIVDITNYVMFEIGQPLHAFDQDKIDGSKIYVRKSKSKEKILTLDGENRELPKDSIVIADKKSPIGLAGIMGGKSSEITPDTTNVFLEAANFNSSMIRSTSKKLGLSTEASMRFERNLDPKLAIYALSRAADLIVELAGGKINQKIQDNYPLKINAQKIILIKEKLRNHLGLDISNNQIDQTLDNLNYKYPGKNVNSLNQVSGKIFEGESFSEVPEAQRCEILYTKFPNSPDNCKLSLYSKVSNDEVTAYAIPLEGKGLWSTLYGYLALEKDGSTIMGITFYAHKETPGLGAEISKPWFSDNFKGKKLLDQSGSLASVKVFKGKAKDSGLPEDHVVDGISGATITADGVTDLIKHCAEVFDPFLSKIRKVGA